MDNQTTEQVKIEEKRIPNPTGKGGFQEHPELINAGGRPKNQESFTYWFNFFKNLTGDELKQWALDNTPDNRTTAAHLAYMRIRNAEGSLKEFKEVADRTEGKPRQPIGIDGELISRVKVIIKK